MSMQYKRIFAALDGAKTQEMVAERAIELAASEHADLGVWPRSRFRAL